MTKEQRIAIAGIINDMINANIRVPREALLLIALQHCLVDNIIIVEGNIPSFKTYICSCSTGRAGLNDHYMVYWGSYCLSRQNSYFVA